jgi:maleate isomerase
MLREKEELIVLSPAKFAPTLSALPRIAHLIVASDEVGEAAFRSLIPESLARIFTTRMAYIGDEECGYSFRDSFEEIMHSLPLPDKLDAVVFGCTSASVVLGPSFLEHELSRYCPNAKVIVMGNAVVDAFNALRVTDIALLTPYPNGSHKAVADFLRSEGFTITAEACFGFHTDREIGTVSPESIFAAAHSLMSNGQAKGIFISCAGIPIVDHVKRLEQELGAPVVVSAQAAAWKTMRLLSLKSMVHSSALMRLTSA